MELKRINDSIYRVFLEIFNKISRIGDSVEKLFDKLDTVLIKKLNENPDGIGQHFGRTNHENNIPEPVKKDVPILKRDTMAYRSMVTEWLVRYLYNRNDIVHLQEIKRDFKEASFFKEIKIEDPLQYMENILFNLKKNGVLERPQLGWYRIRKVKDGK